jgi:hypothetical protein
VKSKIKYKWKIKEFITGIIVGVITTFIGIFISNLVQDHRELKQISSIEPVIEIDFQDLNDSTIYLTIRSVNKGGALIDKLFLQFDIPGVFTNYETQYQDKISNFTVSSKFSYGHGEDTLAESIIFEGNSLYSSGTIALYIYYASTNIISDTIEHSIFYYSPTLDLHDYMPYYFYWMYNGTSKTVTGTHDMEYLEFIKKDNYSMINHETYYITAIEDQLKYRQDHPISIYIQSLISSNIDFDLLKIPIKNHKRISDTLIFRNDSVIIKSTFTGIFKDYYQVREYESQRRTWY